MPNENSSKKGLTITIIVIILLIAAALIYYFLTNDQEETNTNNTVTNNNTNTTTNTAANTNTTNTNTEVVTEEMADSQQVVSDLIEAAQAEWAEDAVVHSLQSVTSITIVDGVTNHAGYQDGAYREWFGGMYSPSKGEAALVAWQDGVTAIGEPYPGDDFSIAISNSLTSLNSLATGKSSADVFAEAVAQGLTYDGVNTYVDMDIMSADDPSVWIVKQVSANEVDEYEIPVVLQTYNIPSGI